ncbi:MAG: dipeptide epimerase [Candidatus Marinimicrobia bacterium]|nr:dipeptide epimerase [Candidatus Neomarinimicrobiota bacterium]
MTHNRRDFLKRAGLLAASGALIGANDCNSGKQNSQSNKGSKKMELTYKEYELKLKHVFTIAKNSRTTTPDMQVRIHYKGYTGYGEAAMPPYYPENPKSAKKFYEKLDLGQFKDPFQIEKILNYVDNVAEGNHFAKASIDIALHDLVGKLMDYPWYKIWGYDKTKTPSTSFTIGIDEPEMVKKKTEEAERFNVLKVKLGGGNDKEMINSVRSVAPEKPLYVDVNGGWKDKHKALDMVNWLEEQGIEFVEQPMPKDQIEDIAWLTQNSSLPIMADESVQRIQSVLDAYQVYDGINIKLMKCTGMREAHKMINLARSLNMKVLMGCMTATSCSISAAAQLAPAIDWADLDGNLLISNDPYEGVQVVDGKLVLPERPGIGIKPIKKI